jgi:EAL domain-containing protein (putative c-di-GMP-specific phosphodiesterase class I)
MDRLVVESIVTIARGMGKKTVAEFVADEETASQCHSSLKCDGPTCQAAARRFVMPISR